MTAYTIMDNEIFSVDDIGKWKPTGNCYVSLFPQYSFTADKNQQINFSKKIIDKFITNVFIILDKKVKITWNYKFFDKQYDNLSYFLYFTFDDVSEECIFLLQKEHYSLQEEYFLFQ